VVKFSLRYTAIQVTDLDRALDFYLNVLGMRLTTRIKVPETNGELAIVKSEGSDHWLEINYYAGQEYRSGDELDHIAFEVPDLNEALSELKLKGIEAVSHVRDTKNSRWTYIADPDGNWIEIFQKKQQFDSRSGPASRKIARYHSNPCVIARQYPVGPVSLVHVASG